MVNTSQRPLDTTVPAGYHPPMTPLGLRRIRRALGLTQAALAQRLGVRRLAVTRWESGARGISEPIARFVRLLHAGARRKAKPKK